MKKTMPVLPVNVKTRTAMEWLWLAAIILVPLMIIPPNTLVTGFIQIPKVFVFRSIVLILLTLAIWDWALLKNKNWYMWSRFSINKGLFASPHKIIITGAIFLFIAYVISTIASPIPKVSAWGVDSGWDTFALYQTSCYIVLFLVVAAHLRSREQITRLLYVICGVATAVSVYGIGEHFGYNPFDYDPNTQVIVDYTRVRITFGNPIFAGAFLVMCIPLTLGICLQSYISKKFNLWFYITAFSLTAQIAALLFTLSRGPWVGLALGLLVFLALTLRYLPKKYFIHASIFIAIAVLLAFVSSLLPARGVHADNVSVAGRVSGIVEETVSGGLSSRFVIWKTSLKTFATSPWVDTKQFPELPDLAVRPLRPLIGYGPAVFAYAYSLIGETKATSSLVAHGHNLWLHTAVEIGLLGLIAYALILLGTINALRILLKNPETAPLPILILIAISAGLMSRFSEQLTGKGQISDFMLMWILLALVVAMSKMLYLKESGQQQEAVNARNEVVSRRIAVNLNHPTKFVFAVASSLVILVFWWQTTLSPVMGFHYDIKARQAFDAGQIDQGFSQNDRALGWQPEVPLIRTIKAIQLGYAAQGKANVQNRATLLKAAGTEMEVALEYDSLNRSSWSRYAEYSREIIRSENNQASVLRALHIANILVELMPGQWQALGSLGWTQVLASQPQLAIETLEEAEIVAYREKHNPSSIHFMKAIAYRDLGMLDQAVAEMQKTDNIPESEKSNREFAIRVLGNVLSPGRSNSPDN